MNIKLSTGNWCQRANVEDMVSFPSGICWIIERGGAAVRALSFLQCLGTVGWLTGRVRPVKKTAPVVPKVLFWGPSPWIN